MKKNDWKDRLNIVYSTNPNYNHEEEQEETAETLAPQQQQLRIDRKSVVKGKRVPLCVDRECSRYMKITSR